MNILPADFYSYIPEMLAAQTAKRATRSLSQTDERGKSISLEVIQTTHVSPSLLPNNNAAVRVSKWNKILSRNRK